MTTASNIIHFATESLTHNRMLVITRTFLFLAITLCVSNLVQPYTSYSLFATSITLGIVLGTVLACSRTTAFGYSVVLGLLCFVIYLSTSLFNSLDYVPPGSTFFLFQVSEHLLLVGLVFIIMTTTTWAYFRYRGWIILETIVLLLTATEITAPHRKLRFDSPQWMADFAWNLGLTQLYGIIGVGLIILIGVLSYLALGALVETPDKTTVSVVGKRRSPTTHILMIAGLATLCYFVVRQVHQTFTTLAEDKLANGVGQDAKKGESPLSFYSSLGGSSEPVALLRLENDYQENPLQPLLYLREEALSSIAPNGLVVSDFDKDVPRSSPLEVYKADENRSLVERTPLKHSVYLITDHSKTFAADYPTSIVPLKLKKSDRFKSAYRALSLVPSFSKERFEYFDVGDPSWDEETRAHYLEPHPDPRYAELARKITDGENVNIKKVIETITYLNKNAIYTLSPNHTLTTGQDPVAPFLFGDMRGYCVHFAHATVYMLRSLGIPARIGTGYMTDLSQSKDGHTLLRISDRHAWAEVYITERGWVPFDTQPEHVESHANSDMNVELLEELMRSLDPGEEILPESAADEEHGVTTTKGGLKDTAWAMAGLAALMVVSLSLLKVFLLYGYRLTSRPELRLKRAYRSLLIRLYDYGFVRRTGETRLQYAKRVNRSFGISTLSLTPILNELVYGAPSNVALTDFTKMLYHDLNELSSIPMKRRLIASMNPTSVLAFLMRTSW